MDSASPIPHPDPDPDREEPDWRFRNDFIVGQNHIGVTPASLDPIIDALRRIHDTDGAGWSIGRGNGGHGHHAGAHIAYRNFPGVDRRTAADANGHARLFVPCGHGTSGNFRIGVFSAKSMYRHTHSSGSESAGHLRAKSLLDEAVHYDKRRTGKTGGVIPNVALRAGPLNIAHWAAIPTGQTVPRVRSLFMRLQGIGHLVLHRVVSTNELIDKISALTNCFVVLAAQVYFGEDIFKADAFSRRFDVIHNAINLKKGDHLFNVIKHNQCVRFTLWFKTYPPRRLPNRFPDSAINLSAPSHARLADEGAGTERLPCTRAAGSSNIPAFCSGTAVRNERSPPEAPKDVHPLGSRPG